jgi:hypothetical protein
MKLAAIFFVTGLILAMSDGPWFPWVNLAGVCIFSLSPVAAWRMDRKSQRRIINESINRR